VEFRAVAGRSRGNGDRGIDDDDNADDSREQNDREKENGGRNLNARICRKGGDVATEVESTKTRRARRLISATPD
jgi:hypothetical protein